MLLGNHITRPLLISNPPANDNNFLFVIHCNYSIIVQHLLDFHFITPIYRKRQTNPFSQGIRLCLIQQLQPDMLYALPS
ncbi:hypothetical protein D3C76_1303910 [compost metagenome]